VILKLAKGVFAAYAHLAPGSVRVHRGERVREGQLLGKLGNSGISTGPHLHFQLMNRPEPLDADAACFAAPTATPRLSANLVPTWCPQTDRLLKPNSKRPA